MHGDPSEVASQAAEVALIARELGLSQEPYTLLRVGTNVVWTNPTDRVLARVGPKWRNQAAAQQLLDVALRAIEVGAPFTCPLFPDAILLSNGTAVTFWPLGESVDPTPEQMAALSAHLHSLRIPAAIPAWSFTQSRIALRYRILANAIEAGAPSEVTSCLAERYERIVADLCSIGWDNRSSVLLHGDLYPANVVTLNGSLLCCDLDDISYGPCEVDLCATGIHARRMWGGNTCEYFLNAYPYPYDLGLVEALIAEKNVGYCLWLASLWESRPDSHGALMHQVATLDDPTALWEDT